MDYYADERAIDLVALRRRLQSTDLIPSQEPLLSGISQAMSALGQDGIGNLADLQSRLKTPKTIAALAESSGISLEYLRLLKRTVKGFFPKPRSIKEMRWLSETAIAGLNEAGIRNTQHLFNAESQFRNDPTSIPELDADALQELLAISDLCRVQWVSPNFARAIVATGINQATKLAKADPDALSDAIAKANENGKFFKGNVGLRDIRRLVVAARYVP